MWLYMYLFKEDVRWGTSTVYRLQNISEVAYFDDLTFSITT